MATWDDVRRIALALPEAEEHLSRGLLQWRVRKNLFVWERPLRRSDMAALGDRAPDGPIVGARVPGLAIKDALIEEDTEVFFTTPHFNGYAAILAWLDPISVDRLDDLILEAWLDRAPPKLARAYLDRLQ